MTRPSYQALCQSQWAKRKFLCVGIDPVEAKLPRHLLSRPCTDAELEEAYFQFGRAIVDATKHVAGAYKPNAAFYEANGIPALKALYRLVAYIHKVAPDTPVIYDAKRGDIGDTAACYARSAFEIIGADAITLHPILGDDSLTPFLRYLDKGSIVLGHTSNKDGSVFQDKPIGLSTEEFREVEQFLGRELPAGRSLPFYQYVAYRAARFWNNNGNCSLVVGATFPEQLREVRKFAGDNVQILVPGIGKQGGDLAKSVRFGMNSQQNGLWISASSSIIYASNGTDFADQSCLAAEQLHGEIVQCLSLA